MKKKTYIIFSSLLIFGILFISLSLVSAKHAWWHAWGEEPREAPFEATVTLANSAPTIVSWNEPDADTVTAGIQRYRPICALGGTITNVVTDTAATPPTRGLIVTVSDPNGCGDLTDGIVTAYFSKGGVNRPGGGSPSPVTCVLDAPSCSGTSVNFNCPAITMQHYDVTGSDWIVTVTARDGPTADPNSLIATNSPRVSVAPSDPTYPHFFYGSLGCIELQDSNDPTAPLDTITWTGVSTATTNLESLTSMSIFNRGNVAITNTVDFSSPPDAVADDYIQIGGSDLQGQATPTNRIRVDSFSLDDITTPDPAPCGAGAAEAQLLTIPPPLVNIVGALLPLASDAGSSIRPIYFCIESVKLPGGQAGLPTDTYETGAANDWTLNAVMA